jgi:hypothetical protein
MRGKETLNHKVLHKNALSFRAQIGGVGCSGTQQRGGAELNVKAARAWTNVCNEYSTENLYTFTKEMETLVSQLCVTACCGGGGGGGKRGPFFDM